MDTMWKHIAVCVNCKRVIVFEGYISDDLTELQAEVKRGFSCNNCIKRRNNAKARG